MNPKVRITWDRELKLWVVYYPGGGISVHERWPKAMRWAEEKMRARIGFGR